MIMRPVPAFLPHYLAKAEAKRYVAYLDSGKVWTIGIGHTGPEVVKGLVIDQATIERYLAEDLKVAVRKLYKVLSEAAIMRLSENQWAALISFVFNAGAKAHWQIWKSVEAGDFKAVPAQLARFNKFKNPETGKYEVSNGLIHRRAADTAMWNTPDPVDKRMLQRPPPAATATIAAAPKDELPSSGLMRVVDTPPAAPPAHKSAIIAAWTGLGGMLSVAPSYIKQAADTISGWNSGEGPVAQAYGILMGVGAALAVASLVYAWINHQHAKN